MASGDIIGIKNADDVLVCSINTDYMCSYLDKSITRYRSVSKDCVLRTFFESKNVGKNMRSMLHRENIFPYHLL